MSRTRRAQQTQRRRAGLIGIAAMLVVALVAFVAFRALHGLPWQSRYHVTVVLPDAERLIAADDVRSGGVRVGQVEAVDAQPATATHPARARIRLALDRDFGDLPVDSRVRIRSASPLGATYVEVTLGRASADVPDGGTLTQAAAPATPNVVDLFDVFDRQTRASFQHAMRELAGGFAGRGAALNQTVANLGVLLPALTDVGRLLAAPQARLAPFIRSTSMLADALAPVRAQLASLVTGGASTFAAIAGERRALGDAVTTAPAAETAATSALVAARPGLDRLGRVTARLRPVTARLPLALSRVDRALRTGTPALNRLPDTTPRLQTALSAIARVAARPSTDGAVRRLGDTFSSTNQILAALLPAQLQCNLIPLFFQQFASYIGVLGVGQGPSMLNIAVDRPGALGDEIQSASPAPNLHMNYVPHEGYDECEAGNEPFDTNRRSLSNPPGRQAARTRESTPPPHVLELARGAGLLDPGNGR